MVHRRAIAKSRSISSETIWPAGSLKVEKANAVLTRSRMRDKKKSNERRSEEKLPINLNLDRKTPNYSGYIIIRVTPTHTSSKSDDLRKEVKNKLPGLAAFLNQHDRISMRRLIHSVTIDRLREMEEKARASEFAPINSLTNYWRLDCRTLDKRTQEVVEEMQKLPGVELAYMEEAVLDPVVN